MNEIPVTLISVKFGADLGNTSEVTSRKKVAQLFGLYTLYNLQTDKKRHGQKHNVTPSLPRT